MKVAAALTGVALLGLPTALGADPTQLGLGYICSAEHAGVGEPPVAPVMLAGVGDGVSRADTASAEAQAWFNEGLNLYHAFDHIEASAAFARAAALDPTCALCEWGVALGLGPTLNYGITAAERSQALAHATRAAALAKSDDARAKGLIDALIVRYGADPQRDVLFGKAMEDLAQRYPADSGIAVIAAHALMIPGRGADASAVARAEALLERVLARTPDDTAAIHYYIHATEFAGHPAKALPYAVRLATLAPGAGHLVHMAAHTLIHVGEYEQVALLNAEALDVDAQVKARLGRSGPPSAQMYYLHNYVFGLEGALMAGDAALALKYADHARIAFPASFDHGAIAVPDGIDVTASAADRRARAQSAALIAIGRFEPDKALALHEALGDPALVRVYTHYARGEALAARGDAAGVRREVEAIKAIGGSAGAVADIAVEVLAGRAALLNRAPDEAAQHFARAAARQEQAFPFARSFDPPPWWYPVRRSLAYADLAAGKPVEAVREAKASLAAWPNDALALRVLAEAEAKLGDRDAAASDEAAARHAWRGELASVALPLT